VTFEVDLNTSDDSPFTIGKYRYNDFDGILDDFRLYNKSVTEADIAQIMRGNLLRAWAPNPGRNEDVDIEHAATISFNRATMPYSMTSILVTHLWWWKRLWPMPMFRLSTKDVKPRHH
jgi:hypothetical protein